MPQPSSDGLTLWTSEIAQQWRQRGHAFQVLGLYLINGPAVTTYGLYPMPMRVLLEHTGISSDATARAMLAEMGRLRWAFYDLRSEWVWIVDMAFQRLCPRGTLSVTDNRVRGMERWYRELTPNPFLSAFHRRYDSLFFLGLRRDDGPAWTPPEPMSEHDKEIALFELAPIRLGPAALKLSEQLFEQFWACYPRKVARLKALRAWLKIRPLPDGAFTRRAIVAVEEQKRSAAWLREGGQYIPYPATWLHQGRWDDRPVELPRLSPDDVENLQTLAEWVERGDRTDDDGG